jgi:hypothetical protein
MFADFVDDVLADVVAGPHAVSSLLQRLALAEEEEEGDEDVEAGRGAVGRGAEGEARCSQSRIGPTFALASSTSAGATCTMPVAVRWWIRPR